MSPKKELVCRVQGEYVAMNHEQLTLHCRTRLIILNFPRYGTIHLLLDWVKMDAVLQVGMGSSVEAC